MRRAARQRNSNGNATAIDLIVAGDHVVTMDGDRPVLENGAVAVDDGFIVAIGPREEIARRYRARETLDGKDRVVLPGLINGHAHSAMTLMRGIADDRELMDWLRNYIFPTEVRFVDAEFVRIGTELACWEMIRGGTTTFVDMYYFPDAVAEAVESCGLRALVRAHRDRPEEPRCERTPPISLQRRSRRSPSGGRGATTGSSRSSGAHSVYTMKPPQLEAVRARARELGSARSASTSAESRFEIDYAQKNYSKTPIDLLEDIGFLDGPTIGSTRHLSDRRGDRDSRAAQGRRHPQPDLEHEDLLGCRAGDEAAPGRRRGGSRHRRRGDQQRSRPLGGDAARGLSAEGLDDGPEGRARRNRTQDGHLGRRQRRSAWAIRSARLTVGRRADLIQVSLEDLHFTPLYDLVSHLVYVADEQDVVSVVVDGKVLMREGEVLTVDVARVRGEAAALAERIRASVVEKDAAAN